MGTRAAVFDLDGTLMDTIEDLYAAMNEALRACGYPAITRRQVRAYIGCGAYEFVRLAVRGSTADPAEIAACLATYRDIYDRESTKRSAPFAGIVAALDELRGAGVKLAVLSNKPDVATRAVIRNYFGDRFDVVRGQREGYQPKPDPRAVLEVLAELNVTPADAVMIGDGEPDCQTAQRAGMAHIGVLWGYRSREELEAAGARNFAATPGQLVEMLLAAQ